MGASTMMKVYLGIARQTCDPNSIQSEEDVSEGVDKAVAEGGKVDGEVGGATGKEGGEEVVDDGVGEDVDRTVEKDIDEGGNESAVWVDAAIGCEKERLDAVCNRFRISPPSFCTRDEIPLWIQEVA